MQIPPDTSNRVFTRPLLPGGRIHLQVKIQFVCPSSLQYFQSGAFKSWQTPQVRYIIGKRMMMEMTMTKTHTKTKTMIKTKCLKDPSYAIFSKEWGVQGYQWWPPGCLTKIEIARPGTCVCSTRGGVFSDLLRIFFFSHKNIEGKKSQSSTV